ncbi:MAG: hypothetical protein GY810_28030 [Aureispira sp.]|nr:hypothetical protein [Aureispira sp.]
MQINLFKLPLKFCFLCFLIGTVSTNAQTYKYLEFSTLQFGPFYANLQINKYNHPCVGAEFVTTDQVEEGYYFVHSYVAIDDDYIRIGLTSPYVKDFRVFKRTTFTYGIPDATSGTYYYYNPNIPILKGSDSESMYYTKWSEVDVKGAIKAIPNKEPYTPDSTFLASCAHQANVSKEQLHKYLLAEFYPTKDKDYSDTDYTREELKKMVDDQLKVFKKTTELQIRYIENNKPKTITIVFYQSSGECRL